MDTRIDCVTDMCHAEILVASPIWNTHLHYTRCCYLSTLSTGAQLCAQMRAAAVLRERRRLLRRFAILKMQCAIYKRCEAHARCRIRDLCSHFGYANAV